MNNNDKKARVSFEKHSAGIFKTHTSMWHKNRLFFIKTLIFFSHLPIPASRGKFKNNTCILKYFVGICFRWREMHIPLLIKRIIRHREKDRQRKSTRNIEWMYARITTPSDIKLSIYHTGGHFSTMCVFIFFLLFDWPDTVCYHIAWFYARILF